MSTFPPTCPVDHNSFANTNEFVVKHLHLALAADFEKRILTGHVDITVAAQRDGVNTVVLDTSYLDVQEATLLGADGGTSEAVKV